MSPVTDNKQFINFRECVISGYEQSAIVMRSLPIEEVNSKQLYVKFICRPQMET